MKQPLHMMMAPSSRWTPERIVGVGFVGLLHVIAVYALVTGLAQKIVRVVQPDLIVTMDPVQEQKQQQVTPPKLPDLPSTPQDQAVMPPEIVIASDTPAQISLPPTQPTQPTTPSVPDTIASSISSTHTTPPYPGMARKLGEQGTVKLRLTISPQGIITGADVVQSSGFADLDQTTVSWVMSHWKYKPAVQGGAAVTSTTLAAVVFNLKTAG
jgi:protein TonB